ncbi:MAG: glycoside hydrolase family 16 protein [Anaerolineae bacterium]|nr:glycoside hydrolase family 16 protein [Anaerolineae bacterium]
MKQLTLFVRRLVGKTSLIVLSIFLAGLVLSSCTWGDIYLSDIAENISTMLSNDTSSPWQLVWQDEFDGAAGTQPDPEKWGYDLGGQGWGNSEWEYYTDQPENAAMNGEGSLVITASAIPDDTAPVPCWYGPCKFTSARLLTKQKFEFTYGRVEARLKLPYGQGIWPAFWMLGANIGTVGWPQCGEIDIMENIGREPMTIHGTVHGPGYSGAHGIGGPSGLPSGAAFKDDFHVFAVEWEPHEIRWYLDGEQYFQLTPDNLPVGSLWVFDHPFFIIMNVAVGGGWPGYPDDTTTFPQQMQVDYVRVYQMSDAGK